MKYVKNTGSANVKCHIPTIEGASGTQDEIVFRPEHIDRIAGQQDASGYTTLTDEQYSRLEKFSKLFTHCRDAAKTLVVFDDLPYEAQTPSDVIVRLQARVNELEAGGGVNDSEFKDLEDELELVQANLKSATEEIAAFNAVFAEIDPTVLDVAKQVVAEKAKAAQTDSPEF